MTAAATEEADVTVGEAGNFTLLVFELPRGKPRGSFFVISVDVLSPSIKSQRSEYASYCMYESR